MYYVDNLQSKRKGRWYNDDQQKAALARFRLLVREGSEEGAHHLKQYVTLEWFPPDDQDIQNTLDT